MEILGHEPDIAHGTIHYGMPHAQQQGTYKLENGTFADAFHEFTVEWEPGAMRFYVDDNLIYNGDFSEYDDLSDEINWNFILNEGGKGQASISDDNNGRIEFNMGYADSTADISIKNVRLKEL